MYKTMTNKSSVKPTERIAAAMALEKMAFGDSSGDSCDSSVSYEVMSVSAAAFYQISLNFIPCLHQNQELGDHSPVKFQH